MASRIWNSPYTFWLLLALPAIPMLNNLAASSLRGVLHPSGEFSARFMIIAMMLTPLVMLAPRVRAFRWLMARRRALGVAAFAYGALHTLAYVLREGTWQKIVAELPQPGIWTGWLAFALFVILGITSNDASLRWLETKWKTVQRLTYPAAILTLAHWVFESRGLGGIIVHFTPLALLEVYRIGRNLHWWSFRFGGSQQDLRTVRQTS
jgi:sulfoxide reductase heme-binding subunit YedZ